MKKTEARTRSVTTRAQDFGRPRDELQALAGRLRPSPKTKLGGVSDLHIEQMENMSADELEAAYNETP